LCLQSRTSTNNCIFRAQDATGAKSDFLEAKVRRRAIPKPRSPTAGRSFAPSADVGNNPRAPRVCGLMVNWNRSRLLIVLRCSAGEAEGGIQLIEVDSQMSCTFHACITS